MRKFPWSPVLPILFLLLSTGIHVIEPTFVEQMRHRVFDEYQRLNLGRIQMTSQFEFLT